MTTCAPDGLHLFQPADAATCVCGLVKHETPKLLLSQAEAEELYRYTRNEYLSPNSYPALVQLISRLTTRFAPRA